MRRTTWLAAGLAAGIGGTLWAEQRVRRGLQQAVEHLTPEHLAGQAAASVRRAGDRVRHAAEAARIEQHRRELELRRRLSPPAPSHRSPPRRDRHQFTRP